jgi:hypothetical protein
MSRTPYDGMVVRMAVKTTLNLDDREYREARRLAEATGVTVGEYVNRALRDARLRAWHRGRGRTDQGVALPESLAEHEEREREQRR